MDLNDVSVSELKELIAVKEREEEDKQTQANLIKVICPKCKYNGMIYDTKMLDCKSKQHPDEKMANNGFWYNCYHQINLKCYKCNHTVKLGDVPANYFEMKY